MKQTVISVILLIVISALLLLALQQGVFSVTDLSASIALVLVSSWVGILLWGFRSRIERALSPQGVIVDGRFQDLMIHYSHNDDKPDTQNPSRPLYIVNNNTKKAYLIPAQIEHFVKAYKVPYQAHENKEALYESLKNSNIEIKEEMPSFADLGLVISPNSSIALAEASIDSEAVQKLEKLKHEGKLYNFQIWFISPRYDLLSKRGLSIKRLIVHFSDNKIEVYGAPMQSMDLVSRRLLEFEILRPLPWESIPMWCKRLKFIYSRQRYTLEKLLSEAEK